MANHLILDSSVVIKWEMKNEILAEAAWEVLTDHIQGRISAVVPSLLLYEVGNVFCCKNDLILSQAQKFIEILHRLNIAIYETTMNLIHSAMHLADKYQITVYDAAYLSLAKELNSKVISADSKLCEKAKKVA